MGGLEHGQIHGHVGLISVVRGLRRLCGRSREALESRFLDAKVADRVGSVPAPAGGGRVRHGGHGMSRASIDGRERTKKRVFLLLLRRGRTDA